MQPQNPKIYHIVHIDKLQSIIDDGYLWCDAEVSRRESAGTTIGMNSIKTRRLKELKLDAHPNLFVGECVPFYFCPRSVMLYMMYRGNSSDMNYKGGQDNIIHLESDLRTSVLWAEKNKKRWAFTLSNAGSYYFEDRNDLSKLNELDWEVINSNQWSGHQDKKQSEFLCEYSFDWGMIERVGANSHEVLRKVQEIIKNSKHKPKIELKKEWYYGG